MVYIVKAPLVVARLKGGSYAYLYAGTELPDNLEAGEAKRLHAEGFVEKAADAPAPEAPTALADMKAADLKAVADAEGVDLAGARTNADKVAAIEAARAAAVAEPTPSADNGDGGGSDV